MMVDFVPKRYSKPLRPYWLQPNTVEKAKRRIAIAMNLSPKLPNEVSKASATRAVDFSATITAPVLRSTRPEVSTASAVNVQTTIVSAKTSNIPHMPCITGSCTFDAECTITEEPRPASFENTPLFMPQVRAIFTPEPTIPPPTAFIAKAPLKIETKAAPILLPCIAIITKAPII